MEDIVKEILKLKEEKNAVILAHNYQLPEVQDIADFVGDSLGLSQQAAKTDADLILFCGVHFMAETAAIISPQKRVLIPDPDAGCSLASSITADQLRSWKNENPGAVVVSYVNTTAEVKAESDYCCTSSNAVKVVEAIPADKKILFLPDKYLGGYVKKITGREIELWDGACHVHKNITEDSFSASLAEHPDAEFLIHPECGCSSSCLMKSLEHPEMKIHIFSTEGMANYPANSDAADFVVATETGMIHRLRKENPTKRFYPANDQAVCEYMKMITLPKVYEAIKDDKFPVKVNKDISAKAKWAINRMLEIV
jgi:quinolinate synthase